VRVLTTDIKLDAQKMLELYAMRWAIEVYFKESKQHLGFLKEQARHYACYVASIHLTAIRFCSQRAYAPCIGSRPCSMVLTVTVGSCLSDWV
jgi:hypothetical protein